MRLARRVCARVEHFADAFLVSALVVLLLAISWQVFTRYVLGSPTRWAPELARYLVAWITMVGAAVAIRTEGHVAVTIFVDMLPAKWRKIADTIRYSIAVIAAGFLGWYGYELAVVGGGQRAPGLGMSMTLPYLAVPVGCIAILFFFMARYVPKDD
ncbi:TRAP transporter small permease [Aquibaculum sediminis]|uniref:TRAP transporter small permease n=1 Tax=Aquibaculum sediminis TaxID=3231907 RepID=UPI003452C852